MLSLIAENLKPGLLLSTHIFNMGVQCMLITFGLGGVTP